MKLHVNWLISVSEAFPEKGTSVKIISKLFRGIDFFPPLGGWGEFIANVENVHGE